ncbi:hypothetical protein TC41_1745 [Alicyclobacillus acidocaldarius subsp. acidocaldarius Tc-4-1]|uniref:Thioredoxin-like fold domain-containing protein n=1 Tax=Alicyclobacillus acidocaldarius (strain Tc-4-1) TaxID=1048834 RepID=F8ILA6_ALIAT|nr:hypothetical protein TC41_1745 [Alicyclobacillus acidocaldarius subsp. acidocaldarius Tc-4-1]
MQTLETAQVDTASGEAVKLPLDRPVVVFAPWCEYCHRLEQMLSREGLLDQATWVAAGFEIYEYPITQNATTTRSLLTLAEAEQKVKASYEALHLPMPAHVLYAMPGTPLAEAVRGYPDVFVLHDGRWYLQPGYVDAPGFWKTILA